MLRINILIIHSHICICNIRKGVGKCETSLVAIPTIFLLNKQHVKLSILDQIFVYMNMYCMYTYISYIHVQ